jgi:hypothetical protein
VIIENSAVNNLEGGESELSPQVNKKSSSSEEESKSDENES